jgi:hypothetical protein
MAAKMAATMPQNKPLAICDDNEKGELDESGNVSGHEGDTSYTSAETRRSVLKVDLCILPFIMLCFCFLQFDRTNISNALTDTLRTDINVGNADINLAQTLFTVGFIITEIPFNIISKKDSYPSLWYFGALLRGVRSSSRVPLACTQLASSWERWKVDISLALRFTFRGTIRTGSLDCALPCSGLRTALLELSRGL